MAPAQPDEAPGQLLSDHTPSAPDSIGKDAEKQIVEYHQGAEKKSIYAGLGWLDRLLVLWILLAIVIGILLGNFVDSVGPALQRGKFVNVSIPIGTFNVTSVSLPLVAC